MKTPAAGIGNQVYQPRKDEKVSIEINQALSGDDITVTAALLPLLSLMLAVYL